MTDPQQSPLSHRSPLPQQNAHPYLSYLQPRPPPAPPPTHRSPAIVSRGQSISLARRAAATAKKRREEARAELERQGVREGVDAALAGIVGSSASTRANVSQNKAKRQKRVKWTPDEVNALRAGVARYGEGRWAVILREFAPSFNPVRISVDLKDKWRNLYKVSKSLDGASPPPMHAPSPVAQASPVDVPPMHVDQVRTTPRRVSDDIARGAAMMADGAAEMHRVAQEGRNHSFVKSEHSQQSARHQLQSEQKPSVGLHHSQHDPLSGIHQESLQHEQDLSQASQPQHIARPEEHIQHHQHGAQSQQLIHTDQQLQMDHQMHPDQPMRVESQLRTEQVNAEQLHEVRHQLPIEQHLPQERELQLEHQQRTEQHMQDEQQLRVEQQLKGEQNLQAQQQLHAQQGLQAQQEMQTEHQLHTQQQLQVERQLQVEQQLEAEQQLQAEQDIEAERQLQAEQELDQQYQAEQEMHVEQQMQAEQQFQAEQRFQAAPHVQTEHQLQPEQQLQQEHQIQGEQETHAEQERLQAEHQAQAQQLQDEQQIQEQQQHMQREPPLQTRPHVHSEHQEGPEAAIPPVQNATEHGSHQIHDDNQLQQLQMEQQLQASQQLGPENQLQQDHDVESGAIIEVERGATLEAAQQLQEENQLQTFQVRQELQTGQEIEGDSHALPDGAHDVLQRNQLQERNDLDLESGSQGQPFAGTDSNDGGDLHHEERIRSELEHEPLREHQERQAHNQDGEQLSEPVRSNSEDVYREQQVDDHTHPEVQDRQFVQDSQREVMAQQTIDQESRTSDGVVVQHQFEAQDAAARFHTDDQEAIMASDPAQSNLHVTRYADQPDSNMQTFAEQELGSGGGEKANSIHQEENNLQESGSFRTGHEAYITDGGGAQRQFEINSETIDKDLNPDHHVGDTNQGFPNEEDSRSYQGQDHQADDARTGSTARHNEMRPESNAIEQRTSHGGPAMTEPGGSIVQDDVETHEVGAPISEQDRETPKKAGDADMQPRNLVEEANTVSTLLDLQSGGVAMSTEMQVDNDNAGSGSVPVHFVGLATYDDSKTENGNGKVPSKRPHSVTESVRDGNGDDGAVEGSLVEAGSDKDAESGDKSARIAEHELLEAEVPFQAEEGVGQVSEVPSESLKA